MARAVPVAVCVLKICFIEGYTAYPILTTILLLFSRQLLSIFSTDPAVMMPDSCAFILILATHLFTMVVEIMSGYLRGYGCAAASDHCPHLHLCPARAVGCVYVSADHTLFTLLMVYPVTLL